MAKDNFETDVERLFDQAAGLGDGEAFVHTVSARVANLRRTERIVHTTAFSVGGLVAVIGLGQADIWTGLGHWAQRAAAPLASLADPQTWMVTNPLVWSAVLSATLLVVYVGRLLREN